MAKSDNIILKSEKVKEIELYGIYNYTSGNKQIQLY